MDTAMNNYKTIQQLAEGVLHDTMSDDQRCFLASELHQRILSHWKTFDDSTKSELTGTMLYALYRPTAEYAASLIGVVITAYIVEMSSETLIVRARELEKRCEELIKSLASGLDEADEPRFAQLEALIKACEDTKSIGSIRNPQPLRLAVDAIFKASTNDNHELLSLEATRGLYRVLEFALTWWADHQMWIDILKSLCAKTRSDNITIRICSFNCLSLVGLSDYKLFRLCRVEIISMTEAAFRSNNLDVRHKILQFWIDNCLMESKLRGEGQEPVSLVQNVSNCLLNGVIDTFTWLRRKDARLHALHLYSLVARSMVAPVLFGLPHRILKLTKRGFRGVSLVVLANLLNDMSLFLQEASSGAALICVTIYNLVRNFQQRGRVSALSPMVDNTMEILFVAVLQQDERVQLVALETMYEMASCISPVDTSGETVERLLKTILDKLETTVTGSLEDIEAQGHLRAFLWSFLKCVIEKFSGAAKSKSIILQLGDRIMSLIESVSSDESIDKSRISKFIEINEPSQCRSLRLPNGPTSARVSRLSYTNSGAAILALASNALWKWDKDEWSAAGKATATVAPQLWQAPRRMQITNDISDANAEDVVPCFALSKNDSYVMYSSGGKVSQFNMMSFEIMGTFTSPPPAVTFLAFNPQDNNILAIGMDDSTIQIYDIQVAKIKTRLRGHQKEITGLAFSNVLCVLVSSGADSQLCVWSTDGWEKQASKFLQISPLHATAPGDTWVQFHQDQTHLLAVRETQIAIYKAFQQLECLNEWFPSDASGPITDAIYSCDSEFIYVCFENGNIDILTSSTLRIRYRVNPRGYLPPNPSTDVYPLVIAAHPSEPNQFALGLSDGGVYILEPPLKEDVGTSPPPEMVLSGG